MDVIAGSVPRADGAPFQPADLFALWLSHGRAWVQLHSKLAAKGAAGGAMHDACASVGSLASAPGPSQQ